MIVILRRPAALAISAATLALALLVLHDRAGAVDLTDPAATTFPDLLTVAILTVATLASAWALIVTTLTLLGPTGRHLAVALTPRLLRGALLAGLCGAMAVGPAQAVVTSDVTTDTRQRPPSLDGLRLPERTVTSAPATPSPAPAHGEVVVHVGDSLWRIAERRSPGAKVARIAEEAAALHALNRAVIGDDPDLLVPGQHLQIPQGHR